METRALERRMAVLRSQLQQDQGRRELRMAAKLEAKGYNPTVIAMIRRSAHGKLRPHETRELQMEYVTAPVIFERK